MPMLPATPVRTPLRPNKLLLSKWTAVAPNNKEKHFIVVKLVTPSIADAPVTQVELEAVHSKRIITLDWHALEDGVVWRQGWL